MFYLLLHRPCVNKYWGTGSYSAYAKAKPKMIT